MYSHNSLPGVASSLGSALFATLYYYTTLLEPLDGQQVYGWRILLTAPCLALLLIAIGRWGEVRQILRACPPSRGCGWRCHCLPRWSGCSCGCSCGPSTVTGWMSRWATSCYR